MARLRRLALGLFALAAASLSLAAPGALADQYPIHGAVTLTSTHFQIHFAGDPTDPAFIPASRANDVLGFAERAYAKYRSMGYAAPLDDGDGNGKIELYVEVIPAPLVDGFVVPTSPLAATTAGAIHLDVTRGLVDPTDGTKIDAHAISHELFTLFEWAIFHSTNPNDQWFEEGTAEWAAFQVDNTVAPWATTLPEADRALDCIGSECGYTQPVANYNVFYDRFAKSGWSFFQYLSEKYGASIVQQMWAQRALDGAGVPGTTPVDQVLQGKGSSLSAAFNGWTTARLNGAFTMTGIAGVLPTPYAVINTGTTGGALPTKVIAVGHLAARYLQLKPGDPLSTATSCYGATLAINVAVPAGVTSSPAVYVNVLGNPAQALTVSGSTASITVPWSTCTSTPALFLSLPNATNDPTVNGNEFTVSMTLTIDPKSIPPTVLPPAPVKMPGTVISVPTTDSPPSIDVYGPELIQLSADTRVLRLIVSSDGPGNLQATLGSLVLGSAPLRAGHNDVRFTLSTTALTALRRTLSTAGLLMLTPLSPQGAVGTSVVREVAVQPSAPKAKPAPKKKTKAKKVRR